MWARSTLLSGFLVISLMVCLAGRALADLMTGLFPDGVPGYDVQNGVTVETRLHPEQMPLGIREGAFQFMPRLDQTFGYTSNALPGPNRRGSWEIVTNPVLAVDSDWSLDAFGAVASVQDTRFVSLPGQNRTDGAISAGGRIDVGEDKLTLAAAHIVQHEDQAALDAVASDRPVAFTLDDVRASYAITAGPWSIVPSVDVANWTYSDTTIAGNAISQAYRDRVVVQSGVTVRYEFEPLRSVVLVVRAVGQEYTRAPAGTPSLNSTGFQLLAGIDYDDDQVWRWRLLVGEEIRQFASPLYPRQHTLIAEAGVGWSPSGLTSVSATISRETENAAQEGFAGLVYSEARLTIDHEYLRDLLLKASVGLQRAEFFQGGHQTGTTAELGVIWLLNRGARLSLVYDQTDLRGSAIAAGALVAGYSRGVALMTMRLSL